ncbi:MULTISPECIES: chloramphenicol phosphotransferase CPT family protein [Fictibacillus]|uniref:chloramphenicol phosphotransferase CPT family protein n=1 Tax=Fictibacillus TaxID=1329200 RepID=UPI00102925F3|nr:MULTISPECIES: AAA family ATPase [Fictibacillus]RZT23828.1 chloramphenicol 3-O phosphotransferase [Fictibacillus sp. BK138]
MNKGKIILLNGVSSSGKSTLAKELLKRLPDYFHFSIDDFDTIIEKMEDRNSGHLIRVPTEHFFHRNMAMFSDQGVNLVVDQILHNKDTTKDCYEILHDYPVFFVGVHCAINELEKREKERGDRPVGQATSQLNYVHQQGEVYDIEVDTCEGIEKAVIAIVEKISEITDSKAWKTTIDYYKDADNTRT